MRFSWRRRRKFSTFANFILIITTIILLNTQIIMARSFVGPTKRLHCMTCRAVSGDTTQLDQFRVRQSLNEPWCDMEPVECAPQQDTCVTISMQVGPHSFWIGSGCDQRVNYDIPADRDGCVDLQSFVRTYQYRHVEERPTFQQVCICSDDMCNGANRRDVLSSLIFIVSLAVLLRRL